LDALQLAVRLGHTNICFLLLHHGANPDAFDNERNSSLLWLLKNRPSSTGKHIFADFASVKPPLVVLIVSIKIYSISYLSLGYR